GGGGGGSNGGLGGAAGSYGTAGTAGTETKGGDGGQSSYVSYPGGKGGTGFGGGGGGGGGWIPDGGGGGGGGTGGKPGRGYTQGGDGAGPAAGKGGSGTAQNGQNGGYAVPGINGDTSMDFSVLRGSGGGGGSSGSYYGGGGGGGAGGGAVYIISDGEVVINGLISTTGGGGGTGGSDGSGKGGDGGGGAGGGVLISAIKLTGSGTIDARGRNGNTLSETNGGTVKMFYETGPVPSNIIAGRKLINGKPKMVGLLSPENNRGTVPKPTFKWKPAEDPDGDPVTYHLQVSAKSDMSNPILDKEGIKGTEYTSTVAFLGIEFFWRVRARDDFGYGRWSEVWRFVTDQTPPISKVKELPEYINSWNFTVSWEGTDDLAGIESYTIWVSENDEEFEIWLANTPNTSAVFRGREGMKYSFYSVARDWAMNIEQAPGEPDASTTVDTIPPTSNMIALEPYCSEAKFKVSWTGKDGVSGVKDYTVYVSDNGEPFTVWQEETRQTSADYEGKEKHEYTFYVRARDNAGNFEPVPPQDRWTSTKIDFTPPETTVRFGTPNYGRNPTYIKPATLINLTWKDNYVGVEHIYYIIDSRPQDEYTGSINEGIGGHHNISYWSVDRAGNQESPKKLWFFVDTDAPSTTLVFKGLNYTKEDTVFITSQTEIHLLARDSGVGVNYSEYTFQTGAMNPYTGPIMIKKAGPYTLRYRSVDLLYTEEAERSQKLVVDNDPPTTKAIGPSEPQNKDIYVELKALDTVSGVAATYYRVDPTGGPEEGWQTGTQLKIAAATDHSRDGRHRIEYYSVDNVGNKEAVKVLEVVIDTQSELVLDKLVVKGDRVTVSGKAEVGSRVSINDQFVYVRSDGSFMKEYPLKEGGNAFVVKAVDAAGNTVEQRKSVSYEKPMDTAMVGGVAAISILVVLLMVVIAAYLLASRRRPPVKSGGPAAPTPSQGPTPKP
ncbi:MAG: hypothetical protein QXH42_05680, partial [Thermoplasmata archaeon]